MIHEAFIPAIIMFVFMLVVGGTTIYREERRLWKTRLDRFREVAKRNKFPMCSGEIEYYGPDGERNAVCENYQNADFQCRYIAKEKMQTKASKIYFIENPWKII